MINAPSEMRSRFQPAAYMTAATRASTSGTEAATTMPVRQPRNKKDTASTIASASRNECSNSQTDSATTRGWSAYFWISTPAGSSCRTCASRCSSARPKSSTLPLGCMVTPMASTGTPLWRMVRLGGSS